MIKDFNFSILGKLTVVYLILFLSASCDKTPDKPIKGAADLEREKKAEALKALKVPSFNADSAYAYIEKQVAFGPRVPNTPEHIACGDYLIEKLRELTDPTSLVIQSFSAEAYDGTMLRGRNIMGRINPSAKRRILLAAHWDTRPLADQDTERQNEPIDGANDGASGVGALLEIARAIKTAGVQPEAGIDIMLFDLEDYGAPAGADARSADTYCLGSQYWGKNRMPENYSAYYGILFDMVGAQGARFSKEANSMRYAAQTVNRVWETAVRIGHGDRFVNQETGFIIDDHLYVNKLTGIPMIDIIEYNFDAAPASSFGNYWHTHDDNMDIIDRATLKAVGQTILQVLYEENLEL